MHTSPHKIASSIGTFSRYCGVNDDVLYLDECLAFTAKSMLSACKATNPHTGPLTFLSIPLQEQDDAEIIRISPSSKRLSRVYGVGTSVISMRSLKKLHSSARLFFLSSAQIPFLTKQLFLTLPSLKGNSPFIQHQDTRKLADLIPRQVSNELRSNPASFGYSPSFDTNTLLNTSIMTLASTYCHVQRVHFFIEQSLSSDGRALNKIRDCNLDESLEVLLISIPGFNFAYSGISQELRRLVLKSQDTFELMLEAFWTVVLAAAVSFDCSILSFPAVGMGVFLPQHLPNNLSLKIAESYFTTLVKVLSLPKFSSISCIYFNPAGYSSTLDDVLMTSSCSKIINFKGDVLLLAVELSKNNFFCALLNPSDSDVLLGVYDVGEYWKSQGSYVGEEHIAATSTAVLGSAGMNDVYVNADKMVIV
ncbi:hypothetical protein RCL1_004869 [Eukaryota sp. TZLM3-RCL]